MKILQLIDSLDPGGAERMAINYANMLAEKGIGSYLVCTRKEGVFNKLVSSQVRYYFLAKKSTADIGALLRLRRFITDNEIEIVHAHGTSWFFAVLCKKIGKDFKLIWHDHYGNSDFLQERPKEPIRLFSRSFNGIISVNNLLKEWALKYLNCENVISLKNFINVSKLPDSEKISKELQIVCLANFREQKDHFTLLKACDIATREINFRLHLIGQDFFDTYSEDLKEAIAKRSYLTYHGEILFPIDILKRMELGILTSRSEGLPLALLEYGAAELAVICTEVGEAKELIGDEGLLVKAGNEEDIAKAILFYAQNYTYRNTKAKRFKKRVIEEYSQKAIFDSYMNFVKSLC